jgi:DNA-binding MarR family transcriptional regulator
MSTLAEPATATATEIRRGVTRLARRLRAERPADSPSAARIGVLAHLHRYGPSTPGELARAEGSHPQSLTRALAALEADGLLTRTVSPDDRRVSVLAITAAGRALVVRDMAARDAWLAAALHELSEAEVAVLRLAADVMARLEAGDPVAGG